MPVLPTDRLVLREPVQDDAGFIVELLNVPEDDEELVLWVARIG
jgi:hypothetical protein